MKKKKFVWKPQEGMQEAFCKHIEVNEIFYGGARGGGKTDALIGEWLSYSSMYGKSATGILIRETIGSMQEILTRTKELYSRIGAVYHKTDNKWIMPNGAELYLRSIQNVSDLEKIQGHAYGRVYFDEIGNQADDNVLYRLRAALRIARGREDDTIPVGIRLTGNPGGKGHNWLKRLYIDPAPKGMEVLTDKYGLTRMYIPATIKDNPILLKNNPNYVNFLRELGNENLVKAWLHGDWDIMEGAFFEVFMKERHVVEDFQIPSDWSVYRSMDWGYASPFAIGWWTIAKDDFKMKDGRVIPRYAAVKIDEWYGCHEHKHNTGLKLTVQQVAAGIKQRERSKGYSPEYGVADPSIFNKHGTFQSVGETFMQEGLTFIAADNKRISSETKFGGWNLLLQRLNGKNGTPYIYFFRNNCKDSIRILPTLPHDEKRMDDLDTKSEDHLADEARYFIMSQQLPYNVHAEITINENYSGFQLSPPERVSQPQTYEPSLHTYKRFYDDFVPFNV